MHLNRRWWRERAWRLIVAVTPALMSGVLWALARSGRITFIDRGGMFERWARGEQNILAFWHNRVVMMPLLARGQRVCVMISQHRDGDVATRAIQRWGIRAVRGSATRGGVSAFRSLLGAYREGYSLAVVPDGPRGPSCRAKRGVVELGRLTGAPIFPMSYAASRKRQLRSWDKLIIPLPFSRVTYVVGEPLVVPRDAGDALLETLRVELEARLDRATAEAEAALHG